MTATLRFDYHELQIIVIDGTPWVKEWEIAQCIRVDRRGLKIFFKRNRHRFDSKGTRLIEVFTVLGPMMVRIYTAESASLLASYFIGGEAKAFSEWITEAMEKAASSSSHMSSPPAEPKDIASVVIQDGLYSHTVGERLHRGLSGLSAIMGLLDTASIQGQCLDAVAPQSLSALLDLIHGEISCAHRALQSQQ